MEHSYSKDVHPKGNVEVMATRSILIPRPPQCPSCHQNTPGNEDILTKFENQNSDAHFDQLPPLINDNIAKIAMDETDRLTRNVKNNNPDDEDWDLRVDKFGWSKQQIHLYRQISNILDYDQLARLAVSGRGNEGIIRRCIIDKSVARMRCILASVHWDVRLTQWLHGLLSEHLPATYMASYLDILQTLRTKVPTLVDKMLLNRPPAFNQDYMQCVLKRPWGANVPSKSRKILGHHGTSSPIIVIIPPNSGQPSSRMKRWCSLLGTMASIAPIQNTIRNTISIEQVTEQLVAIIRSKIQDLRNEMPSRHIVLGIIGSHFGINSGAAIALQVALVENLSSIICMGLAFNTMKGVRGAPDDRILDIATPILFVLGENSARSSQEEIESLREKMVAQTSLVVVGSADDALRINKFNRHLEGVTQSMVDNMIADEIQDFVSTCIINPPGPRQITNKLNQRSLVGTSNKKESRKRKHKDSSKDDKGTPRKVGRPRLNKTNEMPTGKYKPEKPKASTAMLKQSAESIKQPDQSILTQNEIETTKTEEQNSVAANPAASVEQAAGIRIDSTEMSPFEIVDTEQIVTTTTTATTVPQPQVPTAVVKIPAAPVITSSPQKILQFNNQFIQIKGNAIATTTQSQAARVQQPANMKNILVRKNVTKKSLSPQKPTSQTFFTATKPQTSTTGITPVNPNKQIFIKSQQILVPPNVKKIGSDLLNTMATNPSNSLNSPATQSNDLSGILDLPILFADSDTTIIDQNTQLVSLPTTSNMRIINTSNDTNVSTSNLSNILITSPEGKLPNRPVVISAAKIAKSAPLTTTITTTSVQPTNNRVIFINRGQVKPQTTSQVIKTMPTLKLVSTSLPTVTTAQPSSIKKLTPGTKIDLSTLKIIKDPTVSTNQGQIVAAKPLMIGKSNTTGARNAIFIKSPIQGGNVTLQTHPSTIKTGAINRNITVRKVMNLVPGAKQLITAPASTSSLRKVNILSNVQTLPTTMVITTTANVSSKLTTAVKKPSS